MRISTSMQYKANLAYIQKANSAVDEAAQAYNSGYKFTTAGEDPSGMASKIKYEASISAYDQYAKSAALAADSLAEEETALSAMWTTLASIHTLVIQAVDGTNDQSSLDAIAEEIEALRDQLYDLMNTQNAEGEYIFSGSNTSIPTMTLTSEGTYTCQADGLTRSVQVAPNITVQTSDSGLNIFQNCDLAHTVTNNNSDECLVTISNYDNFDALFSKYYSVNGGDTDSGGTGSNTLTFTIDADTETFTVTDYTGTVIATGEIDEDGLLSYNGIDIQLNEDYESGDISITFDRPEEDNILNQLTELVSILRDEDLSSAERTDKLSSLEVTITNAMEQYDLYLGRVGARESNLDTVLASNESLSDIKTESMANICEIDAFEAASDLLLAQNALEVSQQIYSMINKTSLFDYI